MGEPSSTEEETTKPQLSRVEVESRARNISRNIRCTECGNQSIEESQADIAVLLRKLIREEIQSGKPDKDIYGRLFNEYGETIFLKPRFDMYTAAVWLSPFLAGGGFMGMWAIKRFRQKTNVYDMASKLLDNVPLTEKEKESMLELLQPPRPKRKWWTS
eukprot:TRINITY_DN10526_c0_g1_i1.p1 TRINITY_DN10526_c0_g1~~TRINITY_DN10526_c0_g1_i1.p1  ORF type:complete len:159 (+),score=30.43 TRINITY_DN10526_c0_g1_i1:119-595(+)